MKRKAYRGLRNRQDRKDKHKERAQTELKRLTRDRKKIKIWHWDELVDEEVEYLIVEFNFTKVMTPKRFSELLNEKLRDDI